MPSFDFTVFTAGVDLLSDRSLDAVEDHSDGFFDDAPLEEAAFLRVGGGCRAVFSLVSTDYHAAVKVAVVALREALPEIEIVSVVPGRDPGPVDIT